MKKKIKKKSVKKLFGKAPAKYSFLLEDGRKLRTVYELVDELETMTDQAFNKYVNGMENHFANWIENVFEEKNLAGELREMHDKAEAQRSILKHLVRELMKLK